MGPMTKTFRSGATRCALLFTILACLVHTAMGAVAAGHPSAAAPEPPDDGGLDAIVVTATRVPERASQTLEPLVLVDRTALEDSLGLDVGDVLRFHAGLDIGRSGGPGQPLSLFIRGADSNQSIVMIDGVRINTGTLALAPLMNVSPELFDRIEIVKGPRSAIYGTDAIGGVVNLITRSGGASRAEVLLDYGRYGTGEFALDGIYTEGETSVQAALNGQQSAGFPTFSAGTLDRGYKNLSGTAAVTTHVGDLELGARYWQATGATQYSNAVFAPPDYTSISGFTPLDERFTNKLFAVHAAGDLNEAWHSRLTLSRVVDDLRQDQDDPYLLPVLDGDFDHTSRDSLDWQNDVKIPEVAGTTQTVTFGTILADERTNSLTDATGYSVGTNTQTYYLQDQIQEGQNRVLLAGGSVHHPAFGNHETWNVEYGYSLTADTLLTASAGTAFRAPSATERFGFGGSPNLLPESSRNLEVGLKSRLGEHTEITLAAFQNTIDDLIVTEFDPTPGDAIYYGYQNENIDRARIRGVEAAWILRAYPWTIDAEASLQDPRDLSNATQLLRRTRHSFTLSGSRSFARGELGADLLLSGARADVDFASGNDIEDGGYLLAGLYGKCSVTPAWTWTARLDNAFDRRYELANGYNTARRSLSIATRYSFR
jgi:vitamin B12 transporter